MNAKLKQALHLHWAPGRSCFDCHPAHRALNRDVLATTVLNVWCLCCRRLGGHDGGWLIAGASVSGKELSRCACMSRAECVSARAREPHE